MPSEHLAACADIAAGITRRLDSPGGGAGRGDIRRRAVVIARDRAIYQRSRQPVKSLRQATRANAVREARTCYDHLAGRLGALLCTAFLDAEWITRAPVHRAIRLTEEGRHELHARLGLAGFPP